MWQLIGDQFAEIDALPASDRGFLLGDGVFETFLVRNGNIHLSRFHEASLAAACVAMDLPPVNWAGVEDVFRTKSDPGDQVGKVILTRGKGGRGLTPLPKSAAQVYLSLSAKPDIPASLSLAPVSILREPSQLSSRFKTLSYADFLAARREAIAKGADMALQVSTNGDMAGCDSANLFWIVEDRLYTPDVEVGARAGVVRQMILDQWAVTCGLQVFQVRASVAVLEAAEAVFITNCVLGVCPVRSMGARTWSVDHHAILQLQDQFGA